MSEETWYKMLAVSFALHILFVAAVSIPFKSTKRKIDLSSSYSVNLVGGVGDTGGGQKEAVAREAKKIPGKPVPAVKETKPVPAVKETKPAPAKTKPIPIKKEDLVSLSKKQVPEKQGTTEEEREQLEKKIQNLRRKTEYLDVAKSARSGSATSGGLMSAGSGLSGSGGGGVGIVDPLMQKYHMDVKEKIDAVWRIPGSAKKNLLTVVVIKIRRDGLVVDIIPETMSGNRAYDESIMRAIRAAEPLPRIPTAIKEDTVEVGFNFRPENM
jgi:outer membrane biosynthesis protein TonB